MTISSTTRIAGPFTGNGVTTTFPFAYKVFDAADVQVIRLTISTGIETVLTTVTDYNITLNSDQDSNPGGNIVLVTPLLALYTLTATSDIANLQPTDLTNQGGFYPEVITDALDRATIQIQQISDIGDRTLKIPISDGLLNMELPPTAQRINTILGFGAAGLPTVLVPQASSITGNTVIVGTLGVTGATTLSTTLGVTGAATLSSTLGVTGNLAVNTNKFTVAASSGDTLAAGTFTATGGVVATSLTSKIQPITASIGSSALTITLNPTILDFRNSSLTSGTVTSLVIANAISLTIPSNTTLGTVSTIQSRIVVLAINNAGTVELAVTNIAGGVNLDETGVINTEALNVGCVFTGAIAVTTGILTLTTGTSGSLTIGQALSGTNVTSGTVVKSLLTGTLGANGSTYQTNQFTAAGATTITGVAGIGTYSTTARTSVAYRVVGYIESTQATAGTWATAPSTIQGMGGQALTAMSSIGYGQTWQNVTSSRAYSTTYYNTTSKPIQITITIAADSAGTDYASVSINGVVTTFAGQQSAFATDTRGGWSMSVIIPVGNFYSVVPSGSPTLNHWFELR